MKIMKLLTAALIIAAMLFCTSCSIAVVGKPTADTEVSVKEEAESTDVPESINGDSTESGVESFDKIETREINKIEAVYAEFTAEYDEAEFKYGKCVVLEKYIDIYRSLADEYYNMLVDYFDSDSYNEQIEFFKKADAPVCDLKTSVLESYAEEISFIEEQREHQLEIYEFIYSTGSIVPYLMDWYDLKQYKSFAERYFELCCACFLVDINGDKID